MLNGYQDSERRTVDRVIDDWFALLNHGHLVTATGNSDTHHLTYNIGGYPRNYVRVRRRPPAHLQPFEVARAVKAHHSFFTTGPFVDVRVLGAGPGDLAPAAGGRARVEVDGAGRALGVRVDGARVPERRRGPARRGAAVERGGALSRPLRPRQPDRTAGWWCASTATSRWRRSSATRSTSTYGPLALTNPVFLDVDGNGRYDAPIVHGPHTIGTHPPPK